MQRRREGAWVAGCFAPSTNFSKALPRVLPESLAPIASSCTGKLRDASKLHEKFLEQALLEQVTRLSSELHTRGRDKRKLKRVARGASLEK